MEQTLKNEQPLKSGKNMVSFKKRTITSIIYVVVLFGLCAFKWCTPWGNVAGGWGSLGFDALFTAVSVIGAIEFLRAVDASPNNVNCKISTPQRAFTVAFCAVSIPLYTLIEMIPQTNGSGILAISCAFVIYMMFLAATSVFDHGKSTVRGTIYCVFCMLYCGVFSTLLSAINHLNDNSMAAILMLFLCSMGTDASAYLIGSLLKRFIPFKLAPKLSPNKTVIGSVGGILGGIIAGIIAYYLMYFFGGVNGEVFFAHFNGVQLVTRSTNFSPLLSFVLVGLCASVMCQIGDLFESAVKRECQVKDMGNLLPGHGGVLDRFDSMLFCSTVVLLSFGVIV